MDIHTSTPSSLTTMDNAYWAILTLEETEALCASNYPCPPGYWPPAGWMLSAGGVPVPPVPQGSARQAAITNHFYHELTPEQRMDPQWDPDNYDTWNAFFANRRERELARYEGDGPPPVNHNEAGRRLWWANRTIIGVMRYIAGGDHPRLRCPRVHPPQAPHCPGGSGIVFQETPLPPAVNPRLEWPLVYAMDGLRIPGVAGDDDDDDYDDEEDPEAAYYRTRHDYD